MKNISYFFITFSIILFSCSESTKSDQIPQEKISENTFHVDESGYKFDFTWPEKLSDNQPKITYNETSGMLEITSGEKIQIEISDQDMDIIAKKAELNDDQMFSYNFHNVTDNGYIYQAVLPDGTAYYYSFIEKKKVSDKIYTLSSKEGEEFTLANIKLMKQIAESVK